MEDFIQTASKKIADVQSDGRAFIQRSWRSLRPETTFWLVSSGHFSNDGKLAPSENWRRSSPTAIFGFHDVDDLEHDLGILWRCSETVVPALWVRKHMDSLQEVAAAALDSSVLPAAGRIAMRTPANCEPEFLRLALKAIRRQQLASLLGTIKYERNGSYKKRPSTIWIWLMAIPAIPLLIASPAILGSALSAAARGDATGASLALYLIAAGGVCAYVGNTMTVTRLTNTPAETAYFGWLELEELSGDDYSKKGMWHLAGVGLAEHLKSLMRKNAPIPPVAFDLCFLLSKCTAPNSRGLDEPMS